jgi:uncharacterized membrane protein YeaQ/YmgE (transglycosylase-associated protein family)
VGRIVHRIGIVGSFVLCAIVSHVNGIAHATMDKEWTRATVIIALCGAFITAFIAKRQRAARQTSRQ